MSTIAARSRLSAAEKQLSEAQVASWPPEDPASCVTNVFYAYENIIVSLAEAFGIPWKKDHYKKAALAKQFANENKIRNDVSELMLRLNAARKDVSNGEPGAELFEEDLEELVTDLETMLAGGSPHSRYSFFVVTPHVSFRERGAPSVFARRIVNGPSKKPVRMGSPHRRCSASS